MTREQPGEHEEAQKPVSDPERSQRPPDYIMEAMARAARANLDDLFRHGQLIDLPKSGDVLISGDLHGHLANFERIVKIADLPHHPQRHLILQELLHAMYEDTPDNSYRLLEEAALLKGFYPSQVHILLANHDLAEILRLDILKKGRSVLRAFDAALDEAYAFNKDVVRKAYLGFLRTLPWAAATHTGLFLSHSLPDERYLGLFSRDLFTHADPERPELSKTSAAFRLTWGRDLSSHTAAEFATRIGADLLIIGHHPCRNGHAQPNPHTLILDSKDSHGACLLLPLDRKLDTPQIVARVRHLQF